MKTYLITGAFQDGIGLATSRALLADPEVHVIGTYEEAPSDAGRELISQFPSRASAKQLSHGDAASIETFSQTLGSSVLAGFVNCHTYFNIEHPSKIDFEVWQKSLFVNLTMPTLFVNRLQGALSDRAGIVFLTSTEAFRGSFGASVYAASKAALHNVVMTLANTLGARAIRVNAVAAGWIGGVMDTDEVFNMSRRITPLGRLGSPDEVTNVIEFLLSAKSSFVNGTTLVVDGGYLGVDTIAKYEFEASQV